MTDYFALLDEPRRPWLEPDALKKKYLGLSANLHPDRVHSAGEAEKAAAAKQFTELNAAFNCLHEPKSRLLHLLELEAGVKPKDVQQIPADLADLFTEIAAACRQADAFLAEKARTTSPLLRVALFERTQEWIERLRTLQSRLGAFHGRLNEELKSLDDAWTGAASRNALLPRLEELYRLFGYSNRWSSQVQERIVQLSL